MNTVDTDPQIVALAEYLECSVDDVEHDSGFDCYTAEGGEYLVLNDSDAQDHAADYIVETVWAFNADFLSWFVPEGIEASHIEAMRGNQCEDFNDAATALVEAGKGMDRLINEAISADGRGIFIATYDHHEIRHGDWYIYRIN